LASDANYYYVKDAEKLPEIFAKELGSLISVAAREIRIEVTCPEGVRPLGFIGRPEKFEGRRAVVNLSSLAAGENRFLLLRCRPEEQGERKAELASIKITYRDESNDGVEGHAAGRAQVSFTTDARLARESINQEVVAQRELMWNAVKIDEAIAEADAGRLAAAAQTLSVQCEHLAAQVQNAPAAIRPQLDLEVQNLRQRANALQKGDYGAGSRKSMQNQTWNYLNSKQNP